MAMLFQDAMAEALVDQGVDTVFGVIGDGNLFVVDSFQRRPGTRYIGVANEASAVEAAVGYSHVTGRLGVATVTHGPGLTNTVTALIEAVKARVPLLVIAGEVGQDELWHVQRVPQREIAAAAGAGFEQLRRASTAAEDLFRAIRRAHLEKRPIVLNVPGEFQWTQTVYVRSPAHLEHARSRPSADALAAALAVVARAERPVVLAGRGAISPAARVAVLRLARRIGAPVSTTLKARELFRDDPYDLGICGLAAHEVARSILGAADCVISFGAGLNAHTTTGGWLTEGRRLVQIDDDPASLGRFVTPDVAVLGDAAITADELVDMLDEADIPPSGFASPALTAALAARTPPPDHSTDHHVDIHTAVRRIDEAVPADRTVVTDGGRFHVAAWPAVGVEDPQQFVQTTNYGSIGLGMGTALGAAVGRPGHPTLLITGDGGFMLAGMTEFNTAVRYDLDLIVLVLNDSAYGAEHMQFVRRDVDPALSSFDWPDFGPVADALGGRGFTVRSLPELETALAYLPHRDRPVLIDVHIDPDRVPGY
jgi:thiamine pyrophosphate-dependent acetolactate synthase large subunit-like protein